MTRTRIAVIGAGNWGRNHVRTIAGMTDAELFAVCDTDEARRDQLARQYPGTRIVEEPAAAFAGADAVVVATPAATHAAVALEALDEGIPVLIEKPLALSVADAERVVERSARRGVPVLTGHLLLFHPAVEFLRGVIASDELGHLHYLYSQRVNLGQVRQDENALWSFGPHDVSVAMYLTGERPNRVTAHGRSYLQPGVEDVVFLTLEFASGIMVHVQMSWLDPHKERRLTVVGSRKMAVFDDMQAREKVKVYDKGIDRPPEYGSYGESLAVREGDIWIPRIPNVEPLRAELEHFVEVARRTAEPRAPASDGLEVVRVLDAASASLADRGRTVELDTMEVRSP